MSDALIIGGGVIGLTTALALQQRGLAVTLLEKTRPGDGASGAAGGILSPLQPWRSDPAIAALHALSLSRYRHLLDHLQAQGEAVRLTESGLLCLAPNETRAAAAWAQAQGWALIEPDAAALAREEPALAANLSADAGFVFPQVCQVDPQALLGALVRTAKRRGVRIRENCAAQTLAVSKGRVRGAHTAAGFVAADVVVACAGAWLTPLLPRPSVCPEIRPVRGQIIEYATEPGLLRHIISRETPGADMIHYLIPRPHGHILVGSTLEESGFDNSTTAAARAELSGVAAQVLPALARHPVKRQWAGLRPAVQRATPLIGASPEIAGLFINGGHYRNGVALAPASALLLAQLVCGEETEIDAKAFAIGR